MTAGMLAAAQDHDVGGLQLPCVLQMAANAFFSKASVAMSGYAMLTSGNANLPLAQRIREEQAQVHRFKAVKRIGRTGEDEEVVDQLLHPRRRQLVDAQAADLDQMPRPDLMPARERKTAGEACDPRPARCLFLLDWTFAKLVFTTPSGAAVKQKANLQNFSDFLKSALSCEICGQGFMR